ncbi:MAG: hypothetical protein AABX03_00840 [Nanoarchaeota archaeon]
MKRGVKIFVLVSLVLLISISFVSANVFSDFFNNIFGNSNDVLLSPDDCDRDSDCPRTEVCYDSSQGDYCVECYTTSFFNVEGVVLEKYVKNLPAILILGIVILMMVEEEIVVSGAVVNLVYV